MKLFTGLLLSFSLAFLLSCGEIKGDPIDFAKACDQANDGKIVEISGVLAQRGSIFCSNTGGRMECGFDLLEAPGSDKKLRVDIEQDSGANTVDKVERGYKKEDIKIREKQGNPVALDTDKVKVTGKLSVAPAAPGGQGVCFMQVNKIER